MKRKGNQKGVASVVEAAATPAHTRQQVSWVRIGDGTVEGDVAALLPLLNQSALAEFRRAFPLVVTPQDTTTPEPKQLA